MNPLELAQSTLAAPEGDFTLLGLFLQAHIVVQLVMIGLLLASVWSWAIMIDKWLLFRKARREADRFEKVFWSGHSLEELYNGLTTRQTSGMASVFLAAMKEWKRSQQAQARGYTHLTERIDKVMDVTISRENDRVERRLLFLATVGSTSPFIGLFGTVWGIMTAFQAIAVSKDTNLAVVAPGIAEALFATALGLIAAIPAVMAYNKFTNEASRYAGRLEGFADEFSAILSRQIDEKM
ncbi:MAG: protein TolQ [Pseudomonadota bacterium]